MPARLSPNSFWLCNSPLLYLTTLAHELALPASAFSFFFTPFPPANDRENLKMDECRQQARPLPLPLPPLLLVLAFFAPQKSNRASKPAKWPRLPMSEDYPLSARFFQELDGVWHSPAVRERSSTGLDWKTMLWPSSPMLQQKVHQKRLRVNAVVS